MPRASFLAVLLLLAPALAGCEEDIASPDDLRAYYTLWGALDPESGRQAIRIVPITDTVGLGTAAPLPVTVTSVDLATGAETAWRDSVVTYFDESIGHVFLAEARPAYGSDHVIRVVDETGVETSALVKIPPLIEPIRQTPLLEGGVTYPLLWVDAPRLNRVRATYVLEDESCQTFQVTRDLDESMAYPVEFGWAVELPLHEEARRLIQQTGQNLSLYDVTVSVEVASEDWRPPGGTFDPEILVEPGTLSNVTNGFGFVGAAYEQSVRWRPLAAELNRTDFMRRRFGCGA